MLPLLNRPAVSELPTDGWLVPDRQDPASGVCPCRRAVRRSNRDSRDTLLELPVEAPACDADPVMLRVPMLPVLRGLPTSAGSGSERETPALLFGENRNVLGENGSDRPELMLDPKLRELVVPELKLRERD